MNKFFELANSRTVNLLFPLADFLYIYQSEEYNSIFFLSWSFKRIFKRNFQKVGNLTWTNKAKVLYAVSVLLILGFSILVSLLSTINARLSVFMLVIIVNSFLIPLWLVVARGLIYPVEAYLKNRQVNLAEQKLVSLKNLKIVAIAGSVGKTSTRHFLTTLLKEKRIFTTQGNYNTLLGIASEINTKLTNDKEILIAELGEYLPGDLIRLAYFLKPQILIFTKIGSQHIEKFGNQVNLNSEFTSLSNFPSVKKIYLNEENILAKYLENKPQIHLIRPKSYQDYSAFIKNPHIARSNSLLENLSLAIAVSQELGIKKDGIKKRLTELIPLERRLTVKSENGITFIDDSYNISFESAKNALDYLQKQEGRKIIITGGIVEQGKKSEEVNRKYGKLISKRADVAIVAENIFNKWIKEEIESENPRVKVIVSKNPSETPKILGRILNRGDILLIQNELPEIYWH